MIELEEFVITNNIDIVAISESLPKNHPKDTVYKYNLPGFHEPIQIDKDRGTCMLIKQSIDYTRLVGDELHPSCILTKINVSKDESFLVCLLYKSPSDSREQVFKLLEQINHISTKYNKHKIILVGDFNFPEIDWDSETCTREINPLSSQFLELLQINYLNQLITEPTHQRALQKATLVDLVITNTDDFIDCLTLCDPLGMSHHSKICFNIKTYTPPKSVAHETKYLLNKGNYGEMRSHLQDINWEEIVPESCDVDEAWDNLTKCIYDAKEKYIPKIKIDRNKRIVRRTFTASNNLLDMLRQKRASHKVYKKFPTLENLNSYKSIRNRVNEEVRLTKKQRELKIAKDVKQNPKAFFNYISQKTKPKENVTNLINKDGNLTESDLEKAEVLNTFFGEVFTEEDGRDIEFSNKSDIILNNISITTEDMENKLLKLNVNKSCGPDNLHPKILKELASELAYPLKLLFDKTLSEGRIPTKWKLAEVRPIFKKGDKSTPGNYRPVSLTSVCCKIFESFIKGALYSHLADNKLLSQHQFGFCEGRSCVSQLLGIIDDWLSSKDNNTPVDAVYLDFRKAFDTVPHNRLLKKLKGYGIDGNILQWISSFLSGRKQFVSINGQESETVNVTSGVPQGSVLGPTLFIYFINDLPSISTEKTKIFADDTKSYTEIHSINDAQKLQTCINLLVDWSEKWLLRFNSSKCKILHLGKNNPKYEYYIYNDGVKSVLEETTSEKDLGVLVDNNLDFKGHVNETVKKSRQVSGLIMSTIENKTKDIMVLLFKALVRPKLEYANSVWCPYNKFIIKHIEQVQRHYTKRITGTKGMTYYERLVYLKLPSLEYRRVRGDLIETYKIKTGLYDPITTSTLFDLPYNKNTRNNSSKIFKKRAKQKPYQKFFTNRIVNLWNSLPKFVVQAKNLNDFKNKIDSHLNEHKYNIDLELY